MRTEPPTPPSPTTARLVPAPTTDADLPATSSTEVALRLDRSTLTVPPFRLKRFGQTYVGGEPIEIDLRAIEPGWYAVVVVHNFQVEDRNPVLDECRAGIFLAGRREDGSWEEPERMPIECRAVATLSLLDVVAGDGEAAAP